MLIHRLPIMVLIAALACASSAMGQADLRRQAQDAMRRAAGFYHDHVASHGGYVYHYSTDLRQRWGEGVASEDQIWVQPPGTPTVGLAFLSAFEATRDPFYLDAATDAAQSLVYGQLRSGGWTNVIDFDPRGTRTAEYLRGHGRGNNNSSLDDGQTQSAIEFLVRVDRALGFRNAELHQAATRALDALLLAQFSNGAFPQVWTEPVTPQPVIQAGYPDYDWRTDGRVKNYWDMYTLNDNVAGYVANTLITAHEVYQESKYMDSLRKLGDFLILAQMPQPQPGWAQQYSYQMNPIWARKFEPPGISGDETQEVIETLMNISSATGDRRYLQPIPEAIAWLQRSRLADGQLARYYELQSNRPLYMRRAGETYTLTYDDAQLPDHYGWKTASKLEQLELRYAQQMRSGSERNEPTELDGESREREIASVQQAISTLDDRGRWVSTADGTRLVGQLKLPIGTPYLSSQRFSDNLQLLSRFVSKK